jgi:pyrimidine operon attenuation protein/uracil phosphoribosyltransferase
VDLSHVPKDFVESLIISLKIGAHGEDGGVMESNEVSLVDTVFSYGRLVRCAIDAPVIDVHGTACLSNADLATLKVIL